MFTIAWATTSAEASWRGPESGDEQAAVGCSSTSDSEWLCLEVRCTDKGDLAIFGSMTGEVLDGSFELRVDEKHFQVLGRETVLENASSRTRIEGDTMAIVEALKRGSALIVHYPELRLSAGFERISLRGSGKAIGHVERSCGVAAASSGGGDQPVLLRNSSGKVAIGNLNNSNGCAEAKGSGSVAEVQRDGPGGSIDGMWFVDEKYGREFINVDALVGTRELEARTKTLEYLLTPGRRLSTTVRGCGAAGRIQKLVTATER